jgi:flagella basal body P-ring formation protein FlgA
MNLRSFYCLSALLVSLSAPVSADGWHNMSTLQEELKAYLLATLSNESSGHISVQASPIDRNLRLTQCDKPLTFRPQGNPTNASNVTVKVQCTGSHRWSLFASAKIKRVLPILVASRSLNRGEQLEAEDLSVEQRDVSNISYGYISGVEDAIGKQLRRPLRAGDPVRASALGAPQVISKGDQLVVTAKSGALKVVVPGIALSNGKLGQQIRVQNNHSERIFKAKVVSAGHVQVVL